MGRKKIIDELTLLAAARAVFLEQGTTGTTKEIAKRAGVSEAVIFSRYPTKTALFVAALMPADIEVDALIASDIEDPRAALIETGHRLLAHFRVVIPMGLRLMENSAVAMDDLGNHFGNARVETVADKLAEFLRRKNDAGILKVENPIAAAHLLIAAIHSVALYEMMKFHGTDNLDHSIEFFVDALRAGLPPGTGRPSSKDE
jgi:AcrR family transcriptional regulator